MHTYLLTYLRTYLATHLLVLKYAEMNIYTHMRVYIYIHTHLSVTYIYIYVCMYVHVFHSLLIYLFNLHVYYTYMTTCTHPVQLKVGFFASWWSSCAQLLLLEQPLPGPPKLWAMFYMLWGSRCRAVRNILLSSTMLDLVPGARRDGTPM